MQCIPFWHLSNFTQDQKRHASFLSYSSLPKTVWFCFLYYDQIKGKDIVNVHLYHKVTYVYTFLKTSPVFPLYRPPRLYDNLKLHFVWHL